MARFAAMACSTMSLAAGGDPNGAGAVAWPVYDDAASNLVLDTTVTTQTDLRGELCDFWDGVL
jgi:para-nitrobenzyl esterase